nr:hypothetical protein [Tanacetum cinerariifolium]
MSEPLLPDRVFDFPEDELEPYPAYDFFAPAPLPGYAGNPNNKNGWLVADDYLLGELEAMVDEQMVIPAIKEVVEPVAEAEEEQVKENQENDKIGSKPNKNKKRFEAEKSLKQLQWVEEEKLNKTQKEWPKMQTQSKAIQVFKERRKERGQKCNFSKVQPQGPKLRTVESCMAKDDGCK